MFLIYLLSVLSLTLALPVPQFPLEKQFKNALKVISKSSNLRSPRKYEMNGDIKYCGEYETVCEDLDYSSIFSSLTFQGMMHNQPIYVNSTFHTFLRYGCAQENKFRGESVMALLEKVPGDNNKYNFQIDQITFVPFHKNAWAHFTCEEEMAIGREYDIMKVHCKDCDGLDPFRYDKELIGKIYEVEFDFYIDRVETETTGELMRYERQTDEGCRC